MRTYNRTAPMQSFKSDFEDEKELEETDRQHDDEMDQAASPLLIKEEKRNMVLDCVSSVKTLLLTIVAGTTIGFLVVTAIWIASFFALTNSLAREQHNTVFQGMISYVEQKILLMKTAGDQGISIVDSNRLNLTDFEEVKWTQFKAFKRIYQAFDGVVYFTLSPNPSLNPYNMPSIIGYTASGLTDPITFFYNWYGETGNTSLVRAFLDPENGTTLSSGVLTTGYRANEALHRSLQSSAPGWIPAYVFNPCKSPMCNIFIGYFVPSWQDGEMKAYTNVLYNAGTLSGFLSKLTKKGGLTVIVGRTTGKVIAASKFDSLTEQINGTSNSRALNVRELPSRIVAPTFNALQATFGMEYTELMNNSTSTYWRVESISCKYGTGRLFVNAAHFSMLDWIVVYTVPSSVFFEPAIPGATIAIVFSVTIMILSIVICAVIAVLITKPLGKLLSEISKVKSMDLDNIQTNSKGLALISELASIQFNFYAMVRRLKLYRSFLPSHILANLEDGQEEIESTTKKPTVNETNNKIKVDDSIRADSTLASRSSLSTSFQKKTALSKFSLGLEFKEVTTLLFKIANHAELMANLGPTDFVSLHSKLSNCVNRAAARFKGELQECKHNRFTIHWNSGARVNDPVRLALSCAMFLQQETKALGQRTISDMKQEYPKYSIAVVSGQTYVGNLGNNAKKVYNIFGDGIELCEMLEALNGEYNTQIVSNCKSSHVLTRKIDQISYASDKSVPVYEVIEEAKQKADEWMYEMQEQENNNRFSLYDEAYTLFEQGKIEDASKTLNSYLERLSRIQSSHSSLGPSSPSDPVANALMHRLEKMKQLGSTTYKRSSARPLLTDVQFM